MYRFVNQLGAIGVLTKDFFRCLFVRRLEFGPLVDQLDSLGVRSLNIVNLTAISTGMVLALQMGQFLSKFGAKIYVSRVMGLTLFREMGPVLTALMVAGRVGAGISSELGTMTVTDQIDALRSLACNPIQKLVVPRVLATVMILPVLTLFADAVGLLGGLFIAVTQLGIAGHFFYSSMLEKLMMGDLLTGLVKAIVFGYLIAIIACHYGLATSGGADGVGRSTTATVVTASISVLVADFFMTKLFIVAGV